MKTIFRLWIIGMLCLISNSTYAQIVQYSEDGTKGCIDCTEKTGLTERSCFCVGTFQFGLFNNELNSLNSSTEKDKWLFEQELVLASIIKFGANSLAYLEQYNSPVGLSPDYNFEEIQRGYFKDVETDKLAPEYFTKVDDLLKSATNFDPVALENSTLYHKIFDIRKREGTVNPKYGDLKFGEKLIRNMTDTEVDNLFNQHLNIRTTQRIASPEYLLRKSRLEKFMEDGYISNTLSGHLVVHYKHLNHEQALRFMTRYMTWIHQNNLSDTNILTIPFGNPDNIFTLESRETQDLLNISARTTGNHPTMPGYTPPVYRELEDDVAIFNYALNSFDPTARNIIEDKEATKNTAKNYFQGMRYSDKSMKFVNDIMNDFYNGKQFPFDKYPLGAANDVTFHDLYGDQNPHLVAKFRLKTNPGSSQREYYKIDGVLESLFSHSLAPQREDLFGSFIEGFLNSNNINVPNWISNEDLFTMFYWEESLTTPPNPDFTDFSTFRLIMRNGHAKTLWDLGIKFPEMLQLPYVVEGVLALNRGEVTTFDFAFRKKVYDFRKALTLNDAQEAWLVAHPTEFNALNNFYLANNNEQGMNFASEALGAYQNGNFVDFVERIIETKRFENSKANCVYEKMKVKSKSLRMLLKTFLVDDNPTSTDLMFDVEVIVQDDPKYYTHGETHQAKDGIIKIVIDEASLDGKAPIFIAQTIIHEIIHANMNRQLAHLFAKGGTVGGIPINEFNAILERNEFPELFAAIRQYGLDFYQHEVMSQKYLDLIATVLKDFDDNQNPDPTYYEDLAWLGLSKTKLWNDLLSVEKLRLAEVFDSLDILPKECN